MSIEIRDPRISDVVDPSATLETLADGFGFTEGPIWHPHGRHLIFSDIPMNTMYQWTEDSGVSEYRKPSNMANGNTYDHQGRVLTCEHATSRVVRENLDGTIEVLASHWDGKELNSPNDIVVKSDGDIYFTDPTFGRSEPSGVSRELELDFRGVYRICSETGEFSLLASDFTQPNGLAFNTDESELLVADTPELHVKRFSVNDDGTLSGGEVYLHSTGNGWGAPDGLKVASSGHIFCAGQGGVHIYEPEEGVCLGVIQTPAFCANFTWGGDDMKTFFLTSSNHLYRIPLKVSGKPLF
ncbi:MAG: SMP-30/gluconolactonase/LRE family protein [Gammaproteobacteria bacterium]|nr:SMP-30/gluconolactonase/LRE family protein [Gammaproteobacteria bacterium]